MRPNRRELLKTGVGGVLGTFAAGCTGSDQTTTDTEASGGPTETKESMGTTVGQTAEASQKARDIASKLPDFYPSNYAKIIDGAMDEGKLQVYHSMFGALAEWHFKEFNKTFPFIEVESVGLPPSKVSSRFSTEASNGQWNPDVLQSFSESAMAQINKLGLLHEYPTMSPEADNYDDVWKSKNGKVIEPTMIPLAHAWNPQEWDSTPPLTPTAIGDAIVNDTERWNENVAMYDAMLGATGWTMIYMWEKHYGAEKMKNILKQIAKANPRTFWSTSTMGQWVAKSEVHFGINLDFGILNKYVMPDFSSDVLQFSADKEIFGVDPGGSYGISKKPNNPNAAKLFFDWALSKNKAINFSNDWWWLTTRQNISANDLQREITVSGGDNIPLTIDAVSDYTPVMLTFRDLAELGYKQQELKQTWYNIIAG